MQIPTSTTPPNTDKNPFVYVRSYAEETPLHGFNIANRSCNKLDFVVWMTLVTVCSVMAVQQTIQLIHLYQSEPTATSVTLRTRETLTLDAINLCVPFSNHLFDLNLTFTALDMQNYLTHVNVADLQRINTDNLYIPQMETPLIIYLVEMFGRIADAEYKLATDSVSSDTFMWNDNVTRTEPQVLSYLHSFMRENNISLEALLKVTVATVCKRMNIQAFTRLPDGTDIDTPVCSPTNVTFLDNTQFSIRLSTRENPIVLSSLIHILWIKFNVSAVYDRPLSHNLASVPKYYVLFDGKAYQDGNLKSDGNLISSSIDSQLCASVRLRTAYKFYNSRRKPCSESAYSCFDCQSLCWATKISESCNCWPLTAFPWEMYSSSKPVCTERTPISNQTIYIPDFDNCTNFQLSVKILECQRDCVSDCYNREFDFVRETNASYFICDTQFGINYTSDMTTTAWLFTNIFSYSYIEESLTKDWQTFLNEFGGLIGVWLGGSLLAFVHIPLYVLKTIYVSTELRFKKRTAC